MKDGYSYGVVAENVHELMHERFPQRQAVALAYAHARKSFFKTHAKGALPEWLAYPHNYRLREHYDIDGRPNYGVKGFRRNPAALGKKRSSAAIAKAQQLYKDFTGKAPGNVKPLRIPDTPAAGLAFGTLVRIGYRSARDNQLYAHTFRTSSRPLLVASSDGKQLLIVGGRYNFTERGIEDA